MSNMLISIGYRWLAVLHCYLSATGHWVNNQTNYVYLETMLETDTTVVKYRVLIDELRKSPDKPFCAIDGSIANKELRMCCCI